MRLFVHGFVPGREEGSVTWEGDGGVDDFDDVSSANASFSADDESETTATRRAVEGVEVEATLPLPLLRKEELIVDDVSNGSGVVVGGEIRRVPIMKIPLKRCKLWRS